MRFSISKKTLCYDAEVAGLYRKVLSGMSDPSHLALDPDYIPGCDGILYLCRHEESGVLAGTFTLAFPDTGEDNLGRDAGLDPSELPLVAHMDIAAVLKEYRGYGIQKMLMEEAEKDAIALGYRYLMCTIHPGNIPSKRSALSLGYRVVATKEKYGGLPRDILLKEV